MQSFQVTAKWWKMWCKILPHKFQAEFVDSGEVYQGISIRFGIAVLLQCTARYRRYLQVKLGMKQLIKTGFQ